MSGSRNIDHPVETPADGADSVDLDALSGLYRRYTADLRRLDDAGEPVIAAYLAAAIDALETRLRAAGRPVGDRRAATIADIAQGLEDRLGDRALIVAREQLESASDGALATWSAIVDLLERR